MPAASSVMRSGARDLESGLVPIVGTTKWGNTGAMEATTSRSRAATPAVAECVHLQARLLDYASSVRKVGTPNDVLDALHAVISKGLPLRVLGAVRFPIKDASVPSLTQDSQIGANQRVCADAKDRADRSQRG